MGTPPTHLNPCFSEKGKKYLKKLIFTILGYLTPVWTYTSCSFTKQSMLAKTLHCIEGISETPNASADFYCQSNTNNNTWTLCAFYVESSKVNHRQNTQKERARLRDGKRERVRRWFLSKTVIFGFDHRPKSTRDILRYRYWSYLHKVISRRLQIVK